MTLPRRADLLALTLDDLASLSNRGTVKRAQKEIEGGEPTCAISAADDGNLLFQWSDGITCRFPAGRAVQDAVCSSGLLGITRHIIRSVLAYQKVFDSAPAGPAPVAEAEGVSARADVDATTGDAEGATESPPLPSSPTTSDVWDPGAITDDALTAHFRKPAITQARRRFEQGVLVELTRGAKPVARFLDEGCTVRFLVPGDPRYVVADCAESLLPLWVPLAVWAFRELPPDRAAGLVSLQQTDLPVPGEALAALESLLRELAREGVGGAAKSWSQRAARLEPALRGEGLVWPAELLVDLLHQVELYAAHDARFEPTLVGHLVGESVVRLRAIRSGSTTLPQPLIRGTKSDRMTEIAGGRMLGVGLGIRPAPRHTTVSAYLQDADSGSVVAVERTFADPDPKSGDRPRSFADLAGTVLLRGVSLAALGMSQVLLKTGKRTPGGELILPRTSANLTTHPQSYQWEQLKPPFAVEGFRQLAARLETLPPAALRPRRRTENLHVVPLAGADAAEFDSAGQVFTARLRDPLGETAVLIHPFHHRAKEGFDELTQAIETRGDQVRFVCGHVRPVGGVLTIHPVSVIFDDGSRRTGISPWFPQKAPKSSGEIIAVVEPEAEAPSSSPLSDFLQRLRHELSELFLAGVAQGQHENWARLARTARQLGFVRLAAPIAALAEHLAGQRETLHWDDAPAIRQTLDLCLLMRLADD